MAERVKTGASLTTLRVGSGGGGIVEVGGLGGDWFWGGGGRGERV